MPNPVSRYFLPIKILGIIVLILIGLAIAFAAVISITYWAGIRV